MSFSSFYCLFLNLFCSQRMCEWVLIHLMIHTVPSIVSFLNCFKYSNFWYPEFWGDCLVSIIRRMFSFLNLKLWLNICLPLKFCKLYSHILKISYLAGTSWEFYLLGRNFGQYIIFALKFIVLANTICQICLYPFTFYLFSLFKS